MADAIRDLEPQVLWNHFADLNAVPRPSKQEERVIEFVRSFGESLGLPTSVDAIGNVVISKPASPGMESRTPLVMQSHLDMVHQKNAATDFDFASQGIEMYVDGDWVKARGTTLGADNGIGVATIMAILSADSIAHPAVDALFTVDEETGMTGAQQLAPGRLQGKILLNLDTEEDNELTIGCAGGCDVTATGEYEEVSAPAGGLGIRLQVRGLTGGHSGVDIHLGRANANKIMNRLLWHASQESGLRIARIDGGGLRNAIPRESVAYGCIPTGGRASLEALLGAQEELLRSEYATTDPQLEILWSFDEEVPSVMPEELQASLLGALAGCLSGIHRMCPDIEGLVQTSNNLARVELAEGRFTIMCLTRSSVNSERDDLANALVATLGLTGADVAITGAYPGWQPAPTSAIVQLMSELHQELFQEPAIVAACHAGLECGIIGQHYPDLDMISFGPTIRGAHSPDERVSIPSVQKYWTFLLETLQRIPAK